MDLGERAIDRYVADRKAEGAANATINRELAALRRMFRLAERNRMVERVPSFDLLAEHNARKGFLSEGQFNKLLRKLPPGLRPLVTAAYVTGWRKSELLSREWRHVDLDAGWLRLDPGESKNREARQFPLLPRLREALEAQHERKQAIEHRTERVVRPVFFYYEGKKAGEPIKSFREAWANATKAAGCPDLLFHDLRRSAARNLVRAGVSEQAAMKLIGHKTRSIFDRYAIVDESMLSDAGERLAALYDETQADADRKVVSIDGRR